LWFLTSVVLSFAYTQFFVVSQCLLMDVGGVSFEDLDEMIHYYKKEQEKIKKAYLNNNRLEVTLNKLMK